MKYISVHMKYVSVHMKYVSVHMKYVSVHMKYVSMHMKYIGIFHNNRMDCKNQIIARQRHINGLQSLLTVCCTK